MGGRGNSGSRNQAAPAQPTREERVAKFKQDWDEFSKLLETRKYTMGKSIPKPYEKEYKGTKWEVEDIQKEVEEGLLDHVNMDKLIANFANSAEDKDNYLETPRRLNAYQTLVKEDLVRLKTGIRLGKVDLDEAEKRLQVLKVLDRSIEYYRHWKEHLEPIGS